jgi:hypothetical protein
MNFDFFGLFSSLNPDFYWGGEQAAWWGPMAVAIIAGILFATFLTLILVPVMYSLVDDFETFFRKHFARPELEGAAESMESRFEAPTVRPAKTPAREPVPVG